MTRPVLSLRASGEREGGVAWAHRLYNILHWIPERVGCLLGAAGRSSLSLRRLEFSD